MKIVIYKDNLSSGRGADCAVINLANALAENGHDITIATSQSESMGFSSPVSEKVKRLFVKRERPHGIKKILNRLGVLNELVQYSSNLVKAIQKVSPDVIISTGSNEIVELTAAGLPLPPIVQQFHIHPTALFKRRKAKFNDQIRTAIQKANIIQVLLPSHVSMLREVLGSCLPLKTKIVSIGNFSSFEPSNKSSAEKIIAYPAALNADKQQDILIKAFSLIAPKYPDWKLHLYGTGAKAYSQTLQNLINENQLQNQVILKGWCNDMASVYNSCAFIAFPSKIEGFPLTIIDAAYFSKPVVGFTTTSSVADLIQSNKTGLLCEPTADSLAESLEKLITDEVLRKNLGKTAYAYFTTNYTKQSVTSAWCNLLEGVFDQ